MYRKKLAQFMLREDQMGGFDTKGKVEAKADKFYEKEDEEEEDYQPSATVVVSPSVRSRTIRRAEVKEEKEQGNTLVQELPRSNFSKICELLIFAFKFAIFLIMLGAGFLFYTTITSSDHV